MQGAAEHRREVGLLGLERSRVERAVVQSEFASPTLGLREALVALALGAEGLHPAGGTRQLLRARLADQRLVLRDAVVDELGIGARNLRVACGLRVVPVLPQEPGKHGDRRRVVMRIDRAIDAVAKERAEIVREAVGIDTL